MTTTTTPTKTTTTATTRFTETTGKRQSAMKTASCGLVLLAALFVSSATCLRQQQQQMEAQSAHRISAFAARRAADDSRPFKRIARGHSHSHHSHHNHHLLQLAQAESQPQASTVVVGKFKAPAPERVQSARLARDSQFGAQTMSASYRVADSEPSLSEKVVHGVVGASATRQARQQQQQPQSVQRTVSAKMQVSDEGLNYPPSKLSADIYGNVAEIVTAPPEAVDSDFLLPQSSRFGANNNNNNFQGKRK